jgi:hypothetical protein
VRSGGDDNDAIMNALAPLLDGTAVDRPSAAMLLLMPLFQVLPPLLTCSICMEEEPEQQVPAIPRSLTICLFLPATTMVMIPPPSSPIYAHHLPCAAGAVLCCSLIFILFL